MAPVKTYNTWQRLLGNSLITLSMAMTLMPPALQAQASGGLGILRLSNFGLENWLPSLPGIS